VCCNEMHGLLHSHMNNLLLGDLWNDRHLFQYVLESNLNICVDTRW
jgi:hypothetical protein